MYHVRWKDIPADGQTWEPASNLSDAASLEILKTWHEQRACHENEPPVRQVPASGSRPMADEEDPAGACARAAHDDGEVAIVNEDGKEVGKPPKSRTRVSRVWHFFSPKYNSKKDGRVCCRYNICNDELTYSNTTNLHNHLQRKHNGNYLNDLTIGGKVKDTDAAAEKYTVDINNAVLGNISGARKSELDKQFVLWILKSTRPASIGHDPEFRVFINRPEGSTSLRSPCKYKTSPPRL
mmetsp:Transcript_12321/g.34600  ORF Transcript_12321/g.34600 Transcript_12321/m.34600 type:complete len:238 (+) Transcript_12321:238-951(+)